MPPQMAEIFTKVARYGIFRPADQKIPATIALKDIQGPAKASHLADYANLWGARSEGKFVVNRMSLMSESWNLGADKVWRIDQWGFWIGLDGAPTDVFHSFLEQSFDGSQSRSKNLPAKLDSPEVKAKLQELVKHWQEFKP
jgi:hypothetical protein